MARAAAFAALAPARAFAAGARGRGRRRRGQGRRARGRQGRHGLRRRSPRRTRRWRRSSPTATSPAGAPRVVVEERLRGPEASVIALCDGRRRPGAAGRPRPQAAGRRRHGPEHRRHGRLLAAPRRRRRGSSRRSWPASTARRSPSWPAAALPFRGRALRRPDPDGRPGPGPARVQRPVRRPGDAGDPAAAGATPLAPLLLAAARGRLATRPPARRASPVTSLPATPGGGGRDRPGDAATTRRPRRPATPIAGLDDAAATGALVFHAGTRLAPDGGWETDGGRVLAVVGRGAGPRRRARGVGRGGRPTRSTSPALQRRRDIAGRRRAADVAGPSRGPPVIRRYTRPEMGAAWSDEARFAAMLRVEIAVARAQVARGLVPADAFAAIERAGPDRRRPDRRDRADHRPRRHRLRQPGRRGGRARGPLPPPRPHEQRRRRHRRWPSSCGPPATSCCAASTGSWARWSPGPGPRPAR